MSREIETADHQSLKNGRDYKIQKNAGNTIAITTRYPTTAIEDSNTIYDFFE
ncbi:hypothetical protein [Paenibacillus luteus]|uniref:hypothetical protein n=1 Tax=Paenibacillus luteus TaxID=2545753 RepID=UPI0013756A99|nr:hypothetical protein [Paenibacillus luteus]